VVHRYAPIDRFRRTVSRAIVRSVDVPDRDAGERPDPPDPPDPVDAHGELDVAVTPTGEAAPAWAEELEVMRDHLAAAPDLRADISTERAQRATRSASAYLEARRARLKRELRELRERS
jgi:hypothetical protein